MPNPTSGREFEIRATFGPGLDGGPCDVVWFTPEQVSRIVANAVRSGRIPAGRAAEWTQKVMAAGPQGGDAVELLTTMPRGSSLPPPRAT